MPINGSPLSVIFGIAKAGALNVLFEEAHKRDLAQLKRCSSLPPQWVVHVFLLNIRTMQLAWNGGAVTITPHGGQDLATLSRERGVQNVGIRGEAVAESTRSLIKNEFFHKRLLAL